MGEELLLETQHRFEGKYPDVPLASGIDLASLTEGDDDPFFVTLPVVKIGARSKNRRTYDREAVVEIISQINDKRPGGNQGHLAPTDRSHAFPLPPIRWVGAILEETTGTGWAKGYIARHRPDVREYLRTAMRARARVATSLYGLTDTDGERVVNPSIESIDLADPERAGVDEAKAIPRITQEMTEDKKGEEVVADYNELIAERDTLKRQLNEAQATIATLQADKTKLSGLTEMVGDNPAEAIRGLQEFQTAMVTVLKSDDPKNAAQSLLDTQAALVEMVGSDVLTAVKAQRETLAETQKLLGTEDVVAGLKVLQEKHASLITETQAMLAEMITAAVQNDVKVPVVRPIVEKLLTDRKPETREQVRTYLAEILQEETTQALLKEKVVDMMGGAQKGQVVPPATKQSYKFIVIPDEKRG